MNYSGINKPELILNYTDVFRFLEKEHRKINKRAKKIQVELGNHTDAFVNKERLESYRERVE